jgi:sugar lactone lactonase YvrE
MVNNRLNDCHKFFSEICDTAMRTYSKFCNAPEVSKKRRIKLRLISIFILPALMASAALMISISLTSKASSARPVFQSPRLKIVGPDKKPNPVVNVGRQTALSVIDSDGRPVTDVSFQSGSPDVASIDPNTGTATGNMQGFATITARRADGETISTFLTVVRVRSGTGARVRGDMAQDTGNRIYISDPQNNVILRKDSFEAAASVFAGSRGVNGKRDGLRRDALFASPTAIAVDNRSQGGIYITDTLNHSIRRINFNDQVDTILGTGAPGTIKEASFSFEKSMFNSPRGTAIDAGGNLYIADTDNHAIYVADFSTSTVRLLAGEPGVSGKADGNGRAARFFRPTSIDISNDGRTIAVADMGNNRVRLITKDGQTTTLGSSANNGIALAERSLQPEQTDGEIQFTAPQSVNIDASGNIYVVDGSGVTVVTISEGRPPQIVSLAQQGTFGNAVSVVVIGTSAFVLDNAPMTDEDALKSVTVGIPAITGLNMDLARLEGGDEIIIDGKNFAPESRVTLGDTPITNLVVESATRIRFRVARQTVPGRRTLTVRTRGGTAQRDLSIVSKPLSEITDRQITTVSGGIPFLGDGGIATNSVLSPFGLSLDAAGNLFIADTFNNRIRRVDATGDGAAVITTVAGNGIGDFAGDGSAAVSAAISSPESVAVDVAGNLFIADTGNHRIRRVDAISGNISTFAGTGVPSFSGDGGPAPQAGLFSPSGVAFDNGGNLYIADRSNNRIRRVDGNGVITTVAGNGMFSFSGDGGPAVNAALFFPSAVALDSSGNIFISDSLNNRVRRIDAKTRIITTAAGNGMMGFSGDGGLAINASLNLLFGSVAVDDAGNIYIADSNNKRVRRVDSSGIINTIAGTGSPAFNGDGRQATNAGINPFGLSIDGAGNLFIADPSNRRIRRIEAITNTITTTAGNGEANFSGDGGLGIRAGLNLPQSVSLNNSNNIIISDTNNNRVRRIDADTGIINTVAGNGLILLNGDGGQATSAGLSPRAVAIDALGNLFIADSFNNRIRRVDGSTGIITTVAGSGPSGFGAGGFEGDGGPAVNAKLDSPFGVTVDGAGNLYIADTGNNRIRRVDAKTGVIMTTAGNGRSGIGNGDFAGDGGPAANAKLNSPFSVAVDGGGNLFIVDTLNGRIRRADARTGTIATVAGNGSAGPAPDGVPAVSSGMRPSAIAIDPGGNIFIADGNQLIRRVDAATKIITTIAGNGIAGFNGDGGSAVNASLNLFIAGGISFDRDGNLYIADTLNGAIRVVKGAAKGGENANRVVITRASFNKPNLIIDGMGFGSQRAIVKVNGADVSFFIVDQIDTQIMLKGSKKKFNLKKGSNQVTVTANGITSDVFVFNF